MLNTTLKWFNYLFYFLLILFLLDAFHILEIKYQPLKSVVYIGTLCLPVILIILTLRNKVISLKKRLIAISLPFMVFARLCYIGVIQLLFASSAWETYNVLYQHQSNSNLKIELQRQDMGGFGSNKRTVQVQYYTPFFMRTIALDSTNNLGIEWMTIEQ